MGNLVCNSDSTSIARLVNEGIFGAYIEVLNSGSTESIRLILTSVQKLLETGQSFLDMAGINQFAVKFEEAGGLPILDSLQSHPNRKIY